jgi:membrane protease YdiL (CAAX protease family)
MSERDPGESADTNDVNDPGENAETQEMSDPGRSGDAGAVSDPEGSHGVGHGGADAGRSMSWKRHVIALLVALGVAVAGIVAGAGVVFGAIRVIQQIGWVPSSLERIVLSLVLVQGVAFGSVSGLYVLGSGRGQEFIGARLPTLRDVAVMVGGFAAALIAVAIGATIAGVITRALGGTQPAQNQIAEIGAENPEILLVLIPFSYLLIGPGEELLFRGVVQGRLREQFGPAVAIALASAIFASIHYFSLVGTSGGKVTALFVLFFPSVVLGATYEYSGNIVVPSVIHGTYNAVLFLLLYVSITQDVLSPSEMAVIVG